MPDTEVEFDPIRRRLMDAIDGAGTTLAAVSRALGRNHAYLHQFVYRGTPRRLGVDARERIGILLGIDPRELSDGEEPSRRAGRRDAPPSGLNLAAFARRLTIARLESRHETPVAFCRAAGIDRYRFADLEDGADDPTIEELDRIAEISGKTLDWLIRGPRPTNRCAEAAATPGEGRTRGRRAPGTASDWTPASRREPR